MPNIKSAKKRVKVIAQKTAVNKIRKSELKTVLKKANVAIEAKAEDKQQSFTTAVKKIDQAVANGILHKNTAARKKSALAVRLNASNV